MIHAGAMPLVACATMRAIGFSPSSLALAADMRTRADAPSVTPGALPAVTVPSFLKAGFRLRKDSMVESARGDSSLLNNTGGTPFFFDGASPGAFSFLKQHAYSAHTTFE